MQKESVETKLREFRRSIEPADTTLSRHFSYGRSRRPFNPRPENRMRYTRTIKALCAATTAAGLLYLTVSVLGSGRAEADASVELPGKKTIESDRFVVHEWGTFTTFSGSDGVYLDYRPLATEHSDLPNFVLDRLNSGDGIPIFTKQKIRARVRMETPVTYFYTDRPRTVNVRVDFPKGMLTEYYPPAKKILPPLDREAAMGKGELIGGSSIDWGTIDLIPVDSIVSESIAEPLRSQLSQSFADKVLPLGGEMKHYGHARNTDSALVHVHQDEAWKNAWSLSTATEHFEKFLFYRGVGKFELPVAVEFDASSAQFVNRGQQPIRSAILLEIQGGQIKMSVVDRIEADSTQAFGELKPVSPEKLADTVTQRLIAEGLYEKEARSMVETWKSSWFNEQGRRVLYMVPGTITDELLPLHVEPAPQESLRVLVARMELLSPQDEEALLTQLRDSINQRAAFYADLANKGKAYPIPPEIASYGRMAEPALARVATIAKNEAVRREAKWLLAQIRK